MKITFVLNRGYSLFHPEHPETFGGAQIDQYLLGRSLSEKGHHVSFVVHDYGQIEKEQINDNLAVYKSYPPKSSGSLLWQFFRAFRRLYRVLRQINSDIYFMEGANFELFVVAVYCRRHGKTLYYRIASDIEADGRYIREHALQGWLFKLGLKWTTRIIVQTKNQQSWLAKQGHQATIIPNAYPNHGGQGNINGPVLWVGRLIRLKRPEIFLKIARQLPDHTFILIGQAEAIDRDYAADIIEQMKQIKNVTYLPKVGFTEIDAYFQRASLLINTSTYEGFPMTFLQAMSFGIPLVTFGVNPDNIFQKIGGHCVATVGQGVQVIKDYHSPEAWETASRLSRDYFADHFSLNHVVDQYETLFRKSTKNP